MKYSIICLLLVGCNNAKEEINIEKLIDKNKDSSLFLNFWKGMSDEEFELVKIFENENGTLKNGKFYLNEKFPFKIYNSHNSITLTYEDEQWNSYSGDPYYVLDYIKSGNPSNYTKIENILISIFNSKYERIINSKANSQSNLSQYDKYISSKIKVSPNHKEHNLNIQWKNSKDKKIITLKLNYSFLDKNYNYQTSLSGASSTFFNDQKNKKAKIANCHISITYEFLNDYLKRIKKHEENILKQERMSTKRHKQMLEQKRKKDSIISIHNNHL